MTPRVAASDRLRLLVEPAVRAAGCDLEELTVTPAGRRRLLRLVVDRDGGVSLDQVAAVSTAVAATLDTTESMGELPYVLEVTSPGVDRPLTTPRHWQRAAGRRVRVPLRAGGTLDGRVLEADEASVAFDLGGEARRVPLADLGAGAVQVEFRREDEEGLG